MGSVDKVKDYLDTLYNQIGKVSVQESYLIKEDKVFSKRFDWLDIKYNSTIAKLRHRTIIDCEVVLDIDPDKSLFLEEQDNVRTIFLNKLRASGLNYRLFTTHPNYHAHLIFPELRFMHYNTRREWKYKLIKFFNCDTQLSGNNVNIAIEFSKHWKRNNTKDLVEEVRGYNKISCIPELINSLPKFKPQSYFDTFIY
jgi:hypothetical protein